MAKAAHERSDIGPETADPSETALTLSGPERQALMAAYLIGRRQGTLARSGALGRLARTLSPNGAILGLADAYVAASSGRMSEAVARVEMLPMPAPADVPKRNAAVSKLKMLAGLPSKKTSK